MDFKITVDAADGKAEVEEFNAELGRSGVVARESGASITGWGAALNATGAVVGGFTDALQSGVRAAVEFSREMDRQSSIWSRFRGDLGQARTATAGLISDIRMMQAANELAARGIQASGRDLRNIFVAAIEHADATGSDLNETLDQMINAIGSGSPRALRQFGVEGRNANEILDDLDEHFGDVAASADTSGDRIDQFTAALENSETAFMESISNADELERELNALFSTVSGGSGDFEDAMRAMENAARTAGDVIIAYLAEAVREATLAVRALQAIANGDFEEAYDIVQTQAREAMRNGHVDRIRNTVAQRQRARAMEDADGGTDDARVITQADRRPRGRGRRDSEPTLDDLMGDSASREDVMGFGDEAGDAVAETQETIRGLKQETHDNDLRLIDEKVEREREAHEMRLDMLEEEKDKAREATQQVSDDAMGVLGPVVKGLTDSLAQVIAGTKSADEAFQGLLASFLEMIAQESALQAAKEFAAAIASFASQDYPGGALHVAAGVAWTGVAIAAGAASVAVAPAAAQPAAPQQSATSDNGGGGQTIVVNYNSPVITSGTRAELGRELTSMISESDRRYGAAA